ncbi:MAG: mechanosensitive ion channel [Leptospiraceae bacterium]|nr:mechanosensitive ion channel [Leptospiraceae bacterium]MCP5502185.1 mechanosensitive ion channel [Leptospiraceae bacterium]
MKKKHLTVVIFAAFILYLLYLYIPNQSSRTIHIAFMGNENTRAGSYMRDAILLHINNINRRGGIKGMRVELDIYNDEDKDDKARAVAEQLVRDGKALAVIGHRFSTCSLAGGDVYEKNFIPAITPASTNVSVTKGRDWYFRTVFNDNLQGRFLANYSRRILQQKKVFIIEEDLPYGKYLSQVFAETSRELGVFLQQKWSFAIKDPALDEKIQTIVKDFTRFKREGTIFLAMHGKEAVIFIKLLREKGIKNPIITPDSFASEVFPGNSSAFSDTIASVSDIFTTTPLIFDTASEKALEFYDNFGKAYGKEPDWLSAFAYDSALVLMHAIEQAGISGKLENLKEDRKRIRDYLSGMNSIENSVEGVTGFNYFDANGDAPKPVSIGVYKNKSVISALTQLKSVRNLFELSDIERSLKDGLILHIDNRYMYKTNVVYTGIKMNKLSELNPGKGSFFMDFFLWFRFQEDIKPEDIIFTNALEAINLGAPLEEERQDRIIYRLYHVKGTFKLDSLPGRHAMGQHVLGLSFRHRKLSRNNLIYVTDVLGMGFAHSEDLTDRLQKSQVLSNPDWEIDRVWFYQDVSEEDSLGVPRYLNVSGGKVEYSKFNSALRIKKSQISMKSSIPNFLAPYLLGMSFIVVVSFPVLSKRNAILRNLSFVTWFLQVCFTFFLILCAEVVLVDLFVEKTSINKLQVMVTIFDILWWLVPAIFLNWAINRFIWTPLQENTGRKIPTVVRRLISFLIYVLAFFGIIAYVFDQKLTSLLATSGVIAMIIGLAIQINISNIFSGIAINMESPFNVGDWIQMGSYDEGKVIDITWRTTRIKTRDNNVLSIPNAIASESVVKNFNYPDTQFELWFFVHVDPSHTPERVQKILMDAVLSTTVIAKGAIPYTRFKGFTEWSAKYGVYFILDDYGKRYAHEEVVWKRVWSHLNRAGIMPAIQRQELHMFKGVKARGEEAATRPIVLLEEIDIFHPFSDESKKYLSERMHKLNYRPNKTIVQQGEAGNSMFVIVEGMVRVIVDVGEGNTIEVARLGAGNFFGEMSLLTGEARTASIVSGTDTYLYQITKEDIAPLIEKEPEVMQHLSEVLISRKMKTESEKDQHLASKMDKQNQMQESLQQKIQRFFGFGKS